jgi:hypothetical protein
VFLERDADCDVAGRGGREQQVPGRHHRHRPEDHHEPGHQGMPDAPVQAALGERRRAVPDAPCVQPGLPQPEQVAMADPERGAQDECPAGRVPAPEHAGGRSRHAPDGPGDRAPQPEQQDQHQVRGQHEGGALGRLRHDAGPAALEPRAGHHGVLDREQRQQREVGAYRDEPAGPRPLVDIFGHADAREETRGVAGNRQEEQVDDDRVDPDDQGGHSGQPPDRRRADRVRVL